MVGATCCYYAPSPKCTASRACASATPTPTRRWPPTSNAPRPSFNVNALAQIAGVAALGDHEHLARSLHHAAKSRAFYERELRALGLRPVPSHTNFIAVPVGDDAGVTAALAARGFTVMGLSGWGVPGCIRISFGTDDENARFAAALREVLAQP